MGNKAFASDYDGTLDLHRGGGISRADQEAIVRFRAQGGLFGIDTGRSSAGLFAKVEHKIPLDFAVLVSGALVLDGKRQVMWERRIPHDAMKEIVRRFRWDSFGLFLVLGTQYWTVSPISIDRGSRGAYRVVHSLDRIPEPHYGLGFRAPTPKLAARLARTINDEYGDVVTAYQNVIGVDVVPAGCSKATGLAVVKQELKIDLMGAMGDSYNDIPMLQAANVGYTFANAPAQVRMAADALCPSVGVALDRFAGLHTKR